MHLGEKKQCTYCIHVVLQNKRRNMVKVRARFCGMVRCKGVIREINNTSNYMQVFFANTLV